MPRSVYLVRSASGHLKVGASKDPHKRMYLMRVSNAETLELICALEFASDSAATAVEKAAHRNLAEWRVRGEWFAVDCASALGAITEAAASLGVEFTDYQKARKERIAPSKKRGRKRTDSIAVNTRLHPEEITALDAHRGEETRPQAVRKIVRERLGLIKLT